MENKENKPKNPVNPESLIQTNLDKSTISAFEAIASGEFEHFHLLSCFVNGRPGSAIIGYIKQGGSDQEAVKFVKKQLGEQENQDMTPVHMIPLFVRVTPDMELTDHDGNPISHNEAPLSIEQTFVWGERGQIRFSPVIYRSSKLKDLLGGLVEQIKASKGVAEAPSQPFNAERN